MKKIKLMACVILIIVISASMIQADTYTEKQALVNIAIQNSSSLYAQEKSLIQLNEDLEFLKLCMVYQTNLGLANQQYYNLKRLDKKTPGEIKEFNYIQSLIFSTPSEIEKILSINNAKNTILDMEYAIYEVQNNINKQKNYIYLNINELYSELWKTDTMIYNKRLDIKSMEMNYQFAQLKFNKGSISLNDYKNIDLNLKISKLELSKLLRQKKIVESKIKKYANISQKNNIEISFSTPVSDIKLDNFSYYIDFAYSGKSDILNASKYYALMQQKYTESQNYASYTGTNIVDDYSIDMQEAYLALEELKIDTYSQIDMLYKTVSNNLNRVEQTKNLYEYRKTINDENMKRYKLGQLSEYQLTQSNNNYNDSLYNYYNAQAEANISYSRLIYTCGIPLY